MSRTCRSGNRVCRSRASRAVSSARQERTHRWRRVGHGVGVFGFAILATAATARAIESDPQRPNDVVPAAAPGTAETATAPQAASARSGPVLAGRAVLAADTFRPGPTSGQFINARNGRTPPFADRQPIQGFSAVIPTHEPGIYLALSDNGYGAKRNSADYVLRLHRIRPYFLTASAAPGSVDSSFADLPEAVETTMYELAAGPGGIAILDTILLRDPDRRIPWPIIADDASYPAALAPRAGADRSPGVSDVVQQERLLTGYDFDIESVQMTADGHLWIGDEFGPFLLHFDSAGRLLEAPIQLEGVYGIDHPALPPGETPNLGRSRGLEGMAIAPAAVASADGTDADRGVRLYPLLEGPLDSEIEQRTLRIQEFDPAARSFSDRVLLYPLDRASTELHAIGEMTHVADDLFMVIERDNLEGTEATFKKIFLVRFGVNDAQGHLVKHELVDLLAIPDPDGLGGNGSDPETGLFRFPFVTIESVVMIDERTIGVVNDNNYPFSSGRTPNEPDPTEFILISFPHPIADFFPRQDQNSTQADTN